MEQEYKKRINKLVEETSDLELLDLIYKVLLKEGGKNE